MNRCYNELKGVWTMQDSLPINALSRNACSGLMLALLKETTAGAEKKVAESLVSAKKYTDEEIAKVDLSTIGAETPKGSQEKVDKHANDKDLHVTQNERLIWNAKETPAGAKEKVDLGVEDANRYTDQRIARISITSLGSETPEGAQNKVDAHANKRNNPHNVTKSQLGLSNVDDVKQATKTEFFEHLADNVKHVTTGERTAWNLKETPEGAQNKVDIGVAESKSFTSQLAISTLTSSTMYTDQQIAELIDSAPGTLDTLQELAMALNNDPNFATSIAAIIGTKADMIELEAHVDDKTNPHATTKEQVGLGNLDNVKQATKVEFDKHTADTTKHITDAERIDWNSKAEGVHIHPISDVTGLQVTLDEKDEIVNVDSKIALAKLEANQYTDVHDANVIKHIVAAERLAWNAKETPVGAQAKVDLLKTTLAALGFADKSKVISQDLNTMKINGFYYVMNSANVPAVSNGYLTVEVYTTDYVKQTFTTANTHVVYIRTLVDGTWKPWSQVETNAGAQAKFAQAIADARSYTDSVALTKVDKVAGKGLSTEDYTTEEKAKLAGVEPNANKYVHPTTHPASMIVQDATRRMVSDAKISEWDAKETPSGAETKAKTAEDKAKAHSDLNDAMFNHNATLKIFNKPAVFHQNTNNMPGSLVIKAPIGFKNNMISLRLFGYNYTERVSNMDLTLSFYSYSTGSYLQTGFVNRGDFKISSVRGAKDANGKLVLVIDVPNALWAYPKIWIEHLMMSYSTILDSDGVGWTMALETDLTPYTFIKTFPGIEMESTTGSKEIVDAHASDVIKHLTSAERTAWNAKETTIGSKEKADAAVVESQDYTNAEIAKVNPAGIGAETPAGAQAKVDVHVANKQNPHAVTKIQVGLSLVDNVKQATKAEFDAHVADAIKHITSAERTAWNSKETPAAAQIKVDAGVATSKKYTDEEVAKVGPSSIGAETPVGAQAKVDAHANKKDNPHAVTKVQVGLSAVDNVKQASKTEFDTHVSDDVKHITSTERTNWNAKETPTGAQTKATKALNDSKVYTDEKVANLVDSSPAALDTLNELALALGNDPNFATTVSATIGTKADKTIVDAHIADSVKHVTEAERIAWNTKAGGTHSHLIDEVTGLRTELDSKETPAGAQTKATVSENNAMAYSDSLIGNRIIDNRSVIPKPSDYERNRTAQEFKYSKSVGLEGKAGSYVHVFSERAWSDPSGGYVRQLAYDGLTTKMWTRFGNQTTNVWGEWDELENTTGAQAKVDAHTTDAIKHITPSERTFWNGKAAASHLHTIAQTTGLQAELDAKETPTGAQTKVDTHASDTVKHITPAERAAWNAKETTGSSQARVDAHVADKTNPHGVTKAQVGLNNVENAKQATKTEFDSHNNDSIRHITASERAAWNAKANGAHTHGVGDVTGLQAQLDSKAPEVHTHTIAQITNLQGQLDAKETPSSAQAKVDVHANKVDNPHNVTKTQVGLSLVDNAKQATKAEFDTHNADLIKHVTSNERTNWNSKETMAGAQTKATAAKEQAMAVSVSKTGDTMTGELKMEDKITIKSKISIDYNAAEGSLDFVFNG